MLLCKINTLLPGAAQMAQTVKFMSRNVAYRVTVHRTGTMAGEC